MSSTPNTDVTLAFTMDSQEQNQWCWAAVSVSVAKYYNTTTFTQCGLANWAFGQSGPTSCCVDGSTAACNKPNTLSPALTHVGHLASSASGGLSLSAVVAQIDTQRPVGFQVTWTGGTAAHFAVIDGYDNTRGDSNATIDVADPWPAYGTSTVAFSGFPGNYQGGGAWTYSYLTR